MVIGSPKTVFIFIKQEGRALTQISLHTWDFPTLANRTNNNIIIINNLSKKHMCSVRFLFYGIDETFIQDRRPYCFFENIDYILFFWL